MTDDEYSYNVEKMRINVFYNSKSKSISFENINVSHGGWTGEDIKDIISHSNFCAKLTDKEMKEIKKTLYESDYDAFNSIIMKKCKEYFAKLEG